jgi:rhamnosyltransferase
MHPTYEQIAAVIVSYHPEVGALTRLLKAISPQVWQVIVVDNSPDGAGATIAAGCGALAIALGSNLGLAAGFNRGCDKARELGAAFVLLFDQDSEPVPDMVDQLCSAWAGAGERAGQRVAAAGPRFEDVRGGQPPSFLRVGFPRNREVQATGELWVRTDVLISSGCLINMEALRTIGPMDEGLFIDNVDIEWGFRALAKGWILIGAGRAILRHNIGDAHVPTPWWLPLRRKKVIRHSPVRLYYIMRNRILLYWLPHVPFAWKAQDLLRLPGKLVLGVAVAQDRRGSAAALLLGMVHGALGRRGPVGLSTAAGRPAP